MNYQHPALLDKLAAEYVIGTLHGGARRRFEQILRESHAARISVQAWENRLHLMAATVPAVNPPNHVWQKIQARLNPRTRTQKTPWWRALFPLATFACGLCLALGVVLQQPAVLNLQAPPVNLPASYVGFLFDAEQTPTLTASVLRHGKVLSVKQLKPIPLQANETLTLWALPKNGPAFAVGPLPNAQKGQITLNDSAEKLFAQVARLVVTKTVNSAATANPPNAENTLLTGHCAKFW